MVNDTLPPPTAGTQTRKGVSGTVGCGRGSSIRLAIYGERHPSLGFLGTSGRRSTAQLTLIDYD
jgi:hypothetical protein